MLPRAARAFVYYATRLALNVLRSIPELVWALMCILVVGLGPFGGTLAVGLHTGGVLGKLYAETLEEVPARPVEALRATGAQPLQILLWGIPASSPANSRELHSASMGDESSRLNRSRACRRRRTWSGDLQQHSAWFLFAHYHDCRDNLRAGDHDPIGLATGCVIADQRFE